MTTTKVKPYAAILPTILCQQPAVILHWLNEQRATGNLPVEIVLDVLIELASRQISPTQPQTFHELVSTHNAMVDKLEVYKHAYELLVFELIKRYPNAEERALWANCKCEDCAHMLALDAALAAVDKLERTY